MKHAGRVLKGLVKEYLRCHGQSALTVQHHIPIPQRVTLDLIRALTTFSVPSLTRAAQFAMRAHAAFARVRALRLAECCDEFCYKRANFDWVDGRTLVGSTQKAVARGLRDGILLRVQNPPSKTDQDGTKYGGTYMWYRLDSTTDELNFPAAWAALECAFPCEEEERPL